jgi:hypothetical protein
MEGEDIPDQVTYTTLSHCWGKIEDKLILMVEKNIDWMEERDSPIRQIENFSRRNTNCSTAWDLVYLDRFPMHHTK